MPFFAVLAAAPQVGDGVQAEVAPRGLHNGRVYLKPVYDHAPEQAEEFIKHLLLKKLGKKTLIVIVENLDELLKGLKTEGQMKWRAFIQETRQCATLATAQKLSDAVKSRKAPFYGTFQVENLEPLSYEQSLELLKKIATFYGMPSAMLFSTGYQANLGAIAWPAFFWTDVIFTGTWKLGIAGNKRREVYDCEDLWTTADNGASLL